MPGGSAAYPSTVLMTAIPARVAGVKEIFVVTPPKKNGVIPPPTLVAADIAGVNRIFKIGGAQAIAALAFGTESVPKVDKICGPGNVFVVTAKRMVYGTVDIESLAGPSEIIIVADDTADASFCAADLIAQAEHDPQASAILITTSSKLAKAVDSEIKKQLAKLERETIAAKALKSGGMIVIVNNPDEAIELVNLYAPEHVSLMLRNAGSYVQKIRNAGCIFIGGSSPVALGDYIAGPSHVLPTGGSARFSSPLGVEDFLKITNIIGLDEAAGKELGQAAITIAEAEGLERPCPGNQTKTKRQQERDEMISPEDIEGLVRPELKAMPAYTPIEPTDVLSQRVEIPEEKVIKLDGNENPYGCSPRVKRGLSRLCLLSPLSRPRTERAKKSTGEIHGNKLGIHTDWQRQR